MQNLDIGPFIMQVHGEAAGRALMEIANLRARVAYLESELAASQKGSDADKDDS